MTEIQEKVFREFCKHATCIMGGWYPYPCTCVQQKLSEYSLYKIRKTAKELVEMGFIAKSFMYEYDDYAERPTLLNGYKVTEKGAKTEIYQEYLEIERKIVKECFDIEI